MDKETYLQKMTDKYGDKMDVKDIKKELGVTIQTARTYLKSENNQNGIQYFSASKAHNAKKFIFVDDFVNWVYENVR